MGQLEIALECACEDQREALRKYHETGSEADAACVHFESCPDCCRALETLATLRTGQAITATPRRNVRPRIRNVRPRMLKVLLCAVAIGATALMVDFVGLGRRFHWSGAEAETELDRLESRVRFVRMPGRPETCVAAVQGEGGYGPTFMGADACAWVRERIVSDEGITSSLRDYVVTRICGTETCLAHARGRDDDFTLPCGDDD